MSVITKIEQQRNKSRVNIFVDDSFFCGLERETAAVFGLKTGKQVNEEYLKEATEDFGLFCRQTQGVSYLSQKGISPRSC